MAAPKLNVYVTTSERLPELEVSNGQLIFVKDKRQVYFDWSGVRVDYNLITVFETERQRLEEENPIEGFYYVEETAILWRFHDEHWIQINSSPDNPIYFGEQETLPRPGNPNKLYVTDKIIYKWDSLLEDYVIVSNKTEWTELKEG